MFPLAGNIANGDNVPMKLILSPSSVKALRHMPARDMKALLEKLKAVAADPAGEFPWAKRLTDHPGYRVRQGDWRALYRLDHQSGEMVVDRVAKRDEVYR